MRITKYVHTKHISRKRGEFIMEEQNLGIASVPCQTWGDLYTLEEAIKIGTIFKELNKPFFAADIVSDKTFSPQTPQEEDRESLLAKIGEISFVLDDLTLYLDTHPEDQNALNLYKEFSIKRYELKKDFSKRYYPLTRDCIIECEVKQNGFCWQEGPMPWEGALV